MKEAAAVDIHCQEESENGVNAILPQRYNKHTLKC